MVTAMPVSLSAKEFLIVLDPGHGGHDPGTHGRHSNEKDICLSVSNKVKALLKSHKDIKVDATRTTDTYVTLNARANKGNKSMCDLFVSIHCNSLDKSNPRRTTYCGTTVYTMSKDRSTENLAIVKEENSVIELDKLYAPEEQKFDSDELAILSELNQTANIHHSVLAANLLQKQLVKTAGRHDLGTKKAGFLVLRKLTRPSVLIEIDFLCNPTVESFLTSDEGQGKVAKAITDGILAYKSAQTAEDNTS
ncbi:MAG: N-acetylmuramoyl-L-alanine amidase, partial [Paramuribaculum sp.]|nr:N-acetylmuramoyl-L-alanine amidase [Paramuribaculum sp.]